MCQGAWPPRGSQEGEGGIGVKARREALSWYRVPSSWAFVPRPMEFMWLREGRVEADADAVTVWSTGDRTRCWGPGEKKYLNARNATVNGGREKAAACGKGWTKDRCSRAAQATTACGRECTPGVDPDITGRPRHGRGAALRREGHAVSVLCIEVLMRVCATACVRVYLGPASRGGKSRRKGHGSCRQVPLCVKL